MNEHHDVVIVGAGISGLTTAWWLAKAGYDVLVLEQDSRVGGTIRTHHEDGWLVDEGPNSTLETTPLFQELFRDLGLEDDVVYANAAANKRYILRGGELHALPMSPGAFVKSRLWSLGAKLRLLKEPFVGRAEREETVAEFVTRRLGTEFLDYAINPFVAGVYAGNPATLSVQAAFPKLYALERNYGGLIKGQVFGARERKKRAETAKVNARMFSFKQGMQALPDRLQRLLGERVKTDVVVESISESNAGNGKGAEHQIRCRVRGNVVTMSATAVIFAVPSFIVSKFIEPFDRQFASSLRNIYYPPVAEVFFGFKSEQVGRALDGFGFLVPEKERKNILGTIWSSTIFPNRAPAGHVALTTFVGGSRQPDVAGRSDAELLDLVQRDLSDIMQIRGKPVFTKLQRWERAIPQYRLGHLSVMNAIQRFEEQHPGLYFTGNFQGGISVGDCVMRSNNTAGRVTALLQQSQEKSVV